MNCPNCRTRRMVQIGVTLKGARVTLTSCSACELRWWDEEGDRVGLSHVFALAGPDR